MKRMDQVLKETLDSAQSKLPPDERIAGPGQQMCLAEDEGLQCTRAKHETGDHVACGMLGEVHHRWKENEMTATRRSALISAAIASWLENFNNGPAHHDHFIVPMLRGGHRGYEQMDDAELLETVKKEIGYDPNEPYDQNDDHSTEKLRSLGRLINEIERTK